MGSSICTRFEYESDNLRKVCAKFGKTPEVALSDSLLETKIEALDEDWHKVCSAFESVNLADDNIFKQTARETFESTREEYQKTKATMIGLLRQKWGQNQNLHRTDATNASLFHSSAIYPLNTTFDASEICIKMPPCDTQDFYGSYEEWPSFKDMFTAIYGNHPRLTQAQKLYHLRNKTKGEAGSVVDKYPLSDQNFVLAWNSLRARYEN